MCRGPAASLCGTSDPRARAPQPPAIQRRSGSAAAPPRSKLTGRRPASRRLARWRSWQPLEPCEIRLAFLVVRVAPLLRLFGHVEEQSGITRELLDSRQPVHFRIEGRLEASQRHRAVRKDLSAPLLRRLLQFRQRHDCIDQPHFECFRCAVTSAQLPIFTRLLLAHQPRELRRTKPTVEAADTRSGLAEYCVVGRDSQIANYMEHMTAADGETRHHRDDRFGDAANQLLQVEHVEAGNAVVAHVTLLAAYALIAATAKRLRTFASQDDHADLAILARAGKGINHFLHC